MNDAAATTRLLVWDEPDMRTTLASVLVAQPDTASDVDLTAVYLWLARRCQDGEEADARLFALVEPGTEEAVADHITAVRTSGFGVVARPSRSPSASLATALASHLEGAAKQGGLAEVLVASHDGAGLRSALEGLASSGVAVTVLGFRERAGFAADSPQLGFVDLEEVSGAFAAPLPRTNLYDLPEEGLALPPLRRPTPSGSRPVPPSAADRATARAPLWGPVSSPTPNSGDATAAASPTTAPWSAPSSAPESGSAGIGAPAPLATPWSAGSAHSDTDSFPYESSLAEPADGNVASSTGLLGELTSGLAGAAPVEPPPSGPSTAGALDDLLAGVQASPLAPSPPASSPPADPAPPRPGRVSPPNGELDQG